MSNQKYVDIYSHSGGIKHTESFNSKRNVKSSRILKGMLCFFFILLLSAATVASYVFGVYIGRADLNIDDNTAQTKSEISVTQGNTGLGVNTAINSVVGICVYNDLNSEYASGAVISNDGYIITNDHIFKNVACPKIKISFSNGEFCDAAFIGADAKFDVAVIKVERLNLTSINPASNISLGEQVYCIGSPLNATLSMSVTQGIISGLNRRIGSLTREYSPRLIQTDAAINPGTSGGLLINSAGEALGICCSKMDNNSYENIGFAIPIDSALSVAHELIENGQITGRAKLGISYTAIEYTQSLISRQTCGIRIESIEILSDLYGKGFGKGDTITAINGIAINNEDDFLNIIDNSKPNDIVILSIVTSQGVSRETKVTLMEEKPIFSYK